MIFEELMNVRGYKMNYPNGKKKYGSTIKKASGTIDFSNRGMSLEDDINLTNQFYLDQNIAVIHKKPTPVQIVNVHYPSRNRAVIKEAYFKQPSTTDYNGLYKGRYIDFEAKETKSRTSFPLANVHEHQIQHLKQVIAHEGIGFILIRFSTFDETYYLDANRLMQYWDKMLAGGRKSISYKDLQATGILIPFHYQKRVDYLNIVNQLYF